MEEAVGQGEVTLWRGGMDFVGYQRFVEIFSRFLQIFFIEEMRAVVVEDDAMPLREQHFQKDIGLVDEILETSVIVIIFH